jgi:hypothetical protein
MDCEMTWQDWVREALCYDVEQFTMEDIESGLAAGEYQLWTDENAAMVTSGVRLQSGGVGVQVLAAGGAHEQLMGLLDRVEGEARKAGCEILTTVGRIGWIKDAKIRNWVHVASVYVKRLEH